MTAFETTHRDKALLSDWHFVPTSWASVGVGDTILGRDGRTRYVIAIERHYATAIVSVLNGDRREVGEKPLGEAVHVLDDATGLRYTAHVGADAVRVRRAARGK